MFVCFFSLCLLCRVALAVLPKLETLKLPCESALPASMAKEVCLPSHAHSVCLYLCLHWWHMSFRFFDSLPSNTHLAPETCTTVDSNPDLALEYLTKAEMLTEPCPPFVWLLFRPPWTNDQCSKACVYAKMKAQALVRPTSPLPRPNSSLRAVFMRCTCVCCGFLCTLSNHRAHALRYLLKCPCVSVNRTTKQSRRLQGGCTTALQKQASCSR